MTRAPISGFVVAYNRASLVGTCLRSLRFVDELIVIDKSSADDAPAIARRYADRVITVPWSPTVEETREFALQQCRHDWIAFLDDDEMLSPEAITYLDSASTADVVALPLRHWITWALRRRCLLLARASGSVLSQGRRGIRPGGARRHRGARRSGRACF